MDSLELGDKEAKELEGANIIGKQFNSLEEAELFFSLHANMTNFSVRKGQNRRKVDKNNRLRE